VIFEDVTPVDENTVRGRDFHEYMNSKNPLWPANGAGTGVVEFGEGLRP
jgi:hypothetical protein